MKYDLTVIIPVYNTGKYLRRCLESIIHQEGLKQCALRVICINDGSTDNSQTIIEEFIKKYSYSSIICIFVCLSNLVPFSGNCDTTAPLPVISY